MDSPKHDGKKRKFSDSLIAGDGAGEVDGLADTVGGNMQDTSGTATSSVAARLQRENSELRSKITELEKRLDATVNNNIDTAGMASLSGSTSSAPSSDKPTQDMYSFPRVSEDMSVAELKTEAWERGYAAPDASMRDDLLAYLNVGTICLSKVKQIICHERDPSPIGEGEQTAADIFLMHGLPFVALDEMFGKLVYVERSFYEHCLRLLNRHCKAHNPLLLTALARSPAEMRLTWGMYKRFHLPFAMSYRFGEKWPTLQPSDFGCGGDVDILLSVKSTKGTSIWSGVGALLIQSTTKTIFCKFAARHLTFKAPIPVASDDFSGILHLLEIVTLASVQKKTLIKALYGNSNIFQDKFRPPKIPSLIVSVVLRRRSTGKMINVMRNVAPTRITEQEPIAGDSSPFRKFCVEYSPPAPRTDPTQSSTPILLPTLTFDLFSDAVEEGQATVKFSTRDFAKEPAIESGRKGRGHCDVSFDLRLLHSTSNPRDTLSNSQKMNKVLEVMRTWRWG